MRPPAIIDFHTHAFPDAKAPAALVKKDIHFDIGYTRGYLPDDIFKEFLLSYRSDGLLFGSDFPWDDQGEAANHVKTLALPESAHEALFHRNAERLLRITL